MEPLYNYLAIPLDPFDPLPGIERLYPHSVSQAYSLVRSAYNLAIKLLDQEDCSALQLSMLAYRIKDSVLPMYADLAAEIGDGEWGQSCALKLGAATMRLLAAAEDLRESEYVSYFACFKIASHFTGLTYRQTTHVTHLNPVKLVKKPGRGRPRKEIDASFLRDVNDPSRKLTHQKVVNALKIGRTTYYERRKEAKLPPRYSTISDDDLDTMIRLYKLSKPRSGRNFTDAYLRRHGHRVQKERLRASLSRVDRLGQTLRRQPTITRGKYAVPGPNHLWHGDGHHKLIRWGIVIHAFIDGYSRTVRMLLTLGQDLTLKVALQGNRHTGWK